VESNQPPFFQSRYYAEANAENCFDDECHEGQFHGDGEGAGDFINDGAAAEGGAEVPGEDAFQVEPVLDDERVVQVVLVAEGFDQLGGEGLVAGEGSYWVAGGEEHHGVDEEGGAEEDGDHLPDAFNDVPAHVYFSLTGVGFSISV